MVIFSKSRLSLEAEEQMFSGVPKRIGLAMPCWATAAAAEIMCSFSPSGKTIRFGAAFAFSLNCSMISVFPIFVTFTWDRAHK